MDETGEEKKECALCGYVFAAVGLFLGTVFLYMSIDVLSGGKLTSILGLGTARDTEPSPMEGN
jgi:hypothetical protein